MQMLQKILLKMLFRKQMEKFQHKKLKENESKN
jgi:hypothetical protein